MKKISAIFISLVFIIAFVVVGFLGVDIRVGDPITYVKSIVWDDSEFKENNAIKIIKYDDESIKKLKIDYDAKFTYKTMSLNDGYKINIKCSAEPTNATNKKLNYFMSEETTAYTYKVLDDNTCDIMFKQGGSSTLFVRADDGHGATYKINFELVVYDEIL